MNTMDNSNLSYTARDYESILQELIDTIPLLTKEWTAREESDPGIVLVKLMAMVGDMLSYNIDKQALELFPESVTQRKNAYQIYNLLGYKMHWYKSARCTATLYISGFDVTNIIIPRYSRFSTLDGSIIYTNLKDITVSSGRQSVTLELIQGIPKTPSVTNSYSYNELRDDWYNNYNSNLSSDDFINNKYYLNDYNVDEDTIILCDNTGPWVLVEDIDLVSDVNDSYYGNRYFDFRVDEYDRPYIRLCSSWNKDNNGPVNFKLFYILSAGSKGQISKDVLKINNKYISSVTNEKSSEGFDPETPVEAWINSRNWVNTNNTLITCNDFTKAVKRIEGVDNAVALDWMIDVQDPIETNMKDYEVRIYVIPNEDYLNSLNYNDRNRAVQELYQKIDNYIKSNKILHLLNMTYFDKDITKYDGESVEIKSTDVIKHFKWQIEGILYYRTPVSKADSDEIITIVNNTLRTTFSTKNINFNQSIKYIDVVNTILGCDSRILYVDLNPIVYKVSKDGVLCEASEEELTGKHIITIEPNKYFDTSIYPDQENLPDYDESLDIAKNEKYNPCLYEIVVNDYTEKKTTPIKPSTVSIKIDTGNFTIYDDGNGKLVSGIVDGENTIIANGNGTIDYGRYDPIECNANEWDTKKEELPDVEKRNGRIAVITDDNGNKTYYKYSINEETKEYDWLLTDDKPGMLRFELRYATASSIIISYKTNQLAIAEYENLNTEKFYASADSLKRKV